MTGRGATNVGDDASVSCDVCVIGAGPAGSSLALRLAQLGHSVCVVEREAFPRHRVGESLPPSILPVLETLGLRGAVEAAGFLRPRGAIVHWAGSAAVREYGEGAAGFQVDRAGFDALILKAAQSAGAHVIQPAKARRPERMGALWHVPLQGHAETQEIRARFLVDAAGKHSALRPRSQPTSRPTTALYAYWRRPQDIGPQTRVEAGEDVWFWGAPLPGGTFNAAVFLDTDRCAGLTHDQRMQLYISSIAQSELLASVLSGKPLDRLRVCDAGSYINQCPVDAHSLRVGEASCAIDPLSSQGVQSAMASAVQASIVVNTMLCAPEHSDLAREFYTDRQKEASDQHIALSSGHYSRQAATGSARFWQARGVAPFPPATPDPVPGVGNLGADVVLEFAPDAAIRSAPVVEGNLIKAGRALSHPGLERPVVYLSQTPLVPLLEQLDRRQTARQLHENWSTQLGHDHAAAVLNWLWANRIVQPCRSVAS